eukprot:5216264-Alexandrium_andersonii.AAC.1
MPGAARADSHAGMPRATSMPGSARPWPGRTSSFPSAPVGHGRCRPCLRPRACPTASAIPGSASRAA